MPQRLRLTDLIPCKPAASTQNKHKVDITNYKNSYKKGPTHGHPDHPRRQQRLPVPWPSAKFQLDKVDNWWPTKKNYINFEMHPVSEVSGKNSQKSWQDFLTVPLHAWLGASNVPESWAPNTRWGGKNKPSIPMANSGEKWKTGQSYFLCAITSPFLPVNSERTYPQKGPMHRIRGESRAPFGPLFTNLRNWTNICDKKMWLSHPLILVERMI